MKIGIALDLHCRLSNPVSRKDDYFEACMKKLEFILSSCDVLIQAGDVFTKSREEDVCKNRILSLVNKYRIPIYVVPGNHDVENDNPDTLMQTSLGNLAAHGAITILTSDRVWDIGGLKVGVLEYNIKAAKEQKFEEDLDVLVGHHFYNWERDLNQSITESEIEKYNAKHIFLGHDHQPHAPVLVGNTLIHRFGSVMREDLNNYVSDHCPSFAIIEINNNQMSNPVIVEIPHTPFEDAFRWEEKKSYKKCTKLVSDIKEFLQSMDISSGGKQTIGSILKEELNAPEDVLNYLQLIYRVNHIQF